MEQKNKILIVDFGSQYSQIIARRIRELQVYCEIVEKLEVSDITENVKGVILSGGPASVYEKDSPTIDKKIFDIETPVLGI